MMPVISQRGTNDSESASEGIVQILSQNHDYCFSNRYLSLANPIQMVQDSDKNPKFFTGAKGRKAQVLILAKETISCM